MSLITHDWDEEDYETTLREAFAKYRLACYGTAKLNPVQLYEVRQAFLSGIHWLNTRDSYCPDDLTKALRAFLKRSVADIPHLEDK